MSITSDEVNYLIYRYLCESGFVHSAYTFSAESLAAQSHPGTDIPTGALINYLQKGLQYREIETHLNTDGTCTEPFDLLKNHVCSVKRDLPGGGASAAATAAAALVASSATKSGDGAGDEEAGGAAAVTVPAAQTVKLTGHSADVFVCAWNPANPNQLASGSADSTARTWTLQRGSGGGGGGAAAAGGSSSSSSSGSSSKVPLAQTKFQSAELLPPGTKKSPGQDVTSLDWHPQGELLATGSSDTSARLWSARTGELVRSLEEHAAPIFRAKFNPSGDKLLTGSVDTTSIVWDPHTGSVLQRFSVHSAPVLDVDWRDDSVFASCSQDNSVCVCDANNGGGTADGAGANPVMARLTAHADDVNSVRWSPDGVLLASCSDDLSLKIWKPAEGLQPVHDFRTHTKEIYSMTWAPCGPGSPNPNGKLILASGSTDTAVKLWDPEVGRELLTFTRHREQVYSVAFSPDGQTIASGSFDKCVHLWSARDGSLIRTLAVDSGVYEVAWNSDGSTVAASCVNGDIFAFDTRA